MTNFNSELFHARFDAACGRPMCRACSSAQAMIRGWDILETAAIAGLQSVFTDLLLHTDSLDEQLQQHERKITALEEKIAYLEAAIERLSR